MTIDEEKHFQQSESKKRKQTAEDFSAVRAGKLKLSEPPSKSLQDVDTHETDAHVIDELSIGGSKSTAGVHAMEPPSCCGIKGKVQESDKVEESKISMAEPACSLESTGDPLNLLQCYASGSQSSTGTTDQCGPTQQIPMVTPAPLDPVAAPAAVQANKSTEHIQDASTPETATTMNSTGKCKKSVSFAVEVNVTVQDSPASTRRVTRSMSPLNSAAPSFKDSPMRKIGAGTTLSSSPRRSARLATVEATTSMNNSNTHTRYFTRNDQDQVEIDPVKLASSLSNNSMSRKLEMDFGSAQGKTETIEEANRRRIIEDCPSFDLGIDEPGCGGAKDDATMGEEVVIVSSNEDSRDSLDKIYATIEMPATAAGTKKEQINKLLPVSPKNPNSYTPIPQAHKKRVVKRTNLQRSPYRNVENKLVVSRFETEVYNKVCQYGDKSEDPLKKKKMAPQKKHIMPLRMSTKLRNAICIHDKEVKEKFKFSPQNRLDHNE